jgi:hypothetical protein
MWMHPGRVCRCIEGHNKSLSKVRGKGYKGHGGPGGSWGWREAEREFSLSKVLLKDLYLLLKRRERGREGERQSEKERENVQSKIQYIKSHVQES